MDWKLILVLTAFLVYWLYNMAVLCLFSAPESLSMTFYLFKKRKRWQKVLFPIMMVSLSFLLVPSWLEISEGSDLQFMVFFAVAGILFTGCAPAFNKHDLENKVHTGSAMTAALFALLWVAFVANLWHVIVLWFILIMTIAIFTKSLKTSYIYWLETVAFMSTFTSIIVYYIQQLI